MLQSHVILEILCKAGPADDVHGVWSFVQALGYIDDVAWSRDYAKQKWRYSRWAARRISKELRQRGVDVDTVESTLEWLLTVCFFLPTPHALLGCQCKQQQQSGSSHGCTNEILGLCACCRLCTQLACALPTDNTEKLLTEYPYGSCMVGRDNV